MAVCRASAWNATSPVVWVKPEVLCNQGTLVFARDDDYFLGVLESRVHRCWALRMGTALEDRPRYTPTSTFETFPLPWVPGNEPTDDKKLIRIADAGRNLVDKRTLWLSPRGASTEELKGITLTTLHNKRPTWLQNAHEELDSAVLTAYGWPKGLSDDEILTRLLKLNAERAETQRKPGVPAKKSPRRVNGVSLGRRTAGQK